MSLSFFDIQLIHLISFLLLKWWESGKEGAKEVSYILWKTL